MRSSNPVLSRLNEVPRSGYQVPYGYGQPAYSTVEPVQQFTRGMTIDDVVTRTIVLVAITAITAAVSWFALPFSGATALAMIGASLAGLVLVFVISIGRITNPFVISLYAVLQGVMLGVISHVFEQRYHGIVIQAVIGTVGVFAGMAVLYKARVLRATPKFTRFVIGALIGVVVLSLANFVVYMFGGNLGLVDYNLSGQVGFLPILFALVCIGVGALTFILDFDAVEQGIRQGIPERFAWYCAFGLLVGLIYLYWQMLRLLGYLRR